MLTLTFGCPQSELGYTSVPHLVQEVRGACCERGPYPVRISRRFTGGVIEPFKGPFGKVFTLFLVCVRNDVAVRHPIE
jgi:hypothetical protein